MKLKDILEYLDLSLYSSHWSFGVITDNDLDNNIKRVVVGKNQKSATYGISIYYNNNLLGYGMKAREEVDNKINILIFRCRLEGIEFKFYKFINSKWIITNNYGNYET